MPLLKGRQVICPKCGSRDVKEKKSWRLEGGIKNNVFRIHLYRCDSCEKSFRKAEEIKKGD